MSARIALTQEPLRVNWPGTISAHAVWASPLAVAWENVVIVLLT
jgi:hypothetical protein